ncbi:MAG: acyltransferase [Butyrivibrio sp.]|nr:acyltransferase [Butyrivibrio sp.]
MTDKTSVRIAYIDIAKCVGIYLIVMGHMLRRGIILSYLVTAGVPLFFFLSGVTYHYSDQKIRFWRKKIVSLLIPYFFAGMISILIFCILGSFAGKKLGVTIRSTDIVPNLLGLLYANSKTQYMKWNNSLWFIPCLFCVFIPIDLLETFIIRHKLKHPLLVRLAGIFFVLILGQLLIHASFPIMLPWQMETAFNMFLFTECGVIFQKYFLSHAFFSDKNVTEKIFFLLSILLLLLGLFFSLQNGKVSVRTDEYARYPLFILSAFSYISGTLLCCICIGHARLAELIGRHTLPILMWNKFPILIFQTMIPIISSILKLTDTPQALGIAIFPSVIVLFLCLLCGILQEKLIPWSVGLIASEKD